MRRVRQKDSTDCGIACVAMLAGVPYRKARTVVCGNGSSDYELPDLTAALRALGLSPAARLSKADTPHASLTKNALVRVHIGDGAIGHWIVWDAARKRLIDPMEPPYEHVRVVSYVLVE